ncbi:NUDIX domain-containing protein [Micromonospora sp. C95]|uniref:NUDIX domain-containing protein n=1 Tax=Micromonospora sp. C95 TaxID=2824882 RepID=UPI001B35EB44|nr:NUDIX hydrolase [Micromonospora sp. C95]MBQ1027965.1 NUDIX hydrolase [Micromonospora sp. C95]
MRRIVRRSVRAILLNEEDRLVLIKRIKSGQAPYWTTPGGGVESTDGSLEAALRRELHEELGAEADRFVQVFLFTAPVGDGGHFFVCRLLELREDARTGPEFDDPAIGAAWVSDRGGLPEAAVRRRWARPSPGEPTAHRLERKCWHDGVRLTSRESRPSMATDVDHRGPYATNDSTV